MKVNTINMFKNLASKHEICFYYQGDQWVVDLQAEVGVNFCTHAHGTQMLMGHIHPLRQEEHTEEINYYPSAPDMTKPLTEPSNRWNFIVTPIGCYIAHCKNRIPYAVNSDMLYELDRQLHGFYHILNDRINDDPLKFNGIPYYNMSENTYSHIRGICYNITTFIQRVTNLKSYHLRFYSIDYLLQHDFIIDIGQ